jgi:MFS family permease
MQKPSARKDYNIKKVWKRALSAALGFFILGYVLNVFNSSQTCVSSILSWGSNSEFYIALNTAISPFGSLFGALVTGHFSKYYGKRKLMIYSDIITIVGSLINYYPNTITFIIGRFILGFAGGCFSMLTSQYISEFTPPEVYSKMGVLGSLNAMFGNLVSNLACQLLPEDGCNQENKYFIFLLFGFPLFVASFQMFIFVKVFNKESPGWLIRSNQLELAYSSNESIFGTSYAEKELEKVTNLIESKGNTYAGQEESFCELISCKKGTTKGMRVGTMIHLYQQISGINCILMYSTLLYIDLGEGLMLARTLTSLGTFLRMVVLLGFIPFISKVSTKKLVIFGHFMMGSNLLIISFIIKFSDLKILSVCNIFLYLIAFGISIGPLCWSYSSQVMPDKAMALGTGVNWFTCTISVLFFPYLIDLIGLQGAFLLYAGLNFSGALYFGLDMIDIRGKSKQEIREIFSKYR